MAGLMSRNKGKTGEREARDLLLEWLGPVYVKFGVPLPELERNLMQSRNGGHDLVGLPWLAVEVKRQEQTQFGSWWKQTVAQAGVGQIPFLLWRGNRQPWRFRVRLKTYHGVGPFGLQTVDADLDAAGARLWVQTEALWRLKVAAG